MIWRKGYFAAKTTKEGMIRVTFKNLCACMIRWNWSSITLRKSTYFFLKMAGTQRYKPFTLPKVVALRPCVH